MTSDLTLTEFLLARIAEDETYGGRCDCWNGPSWTGDVPPHPHAAPCPARLLLECAAKRRIVEFHESWPVLVEQSPTFDLVGSDLSNLTYRASQQFAWLTEQEYRAKFGDEPPTAPMLAALALVYVDHPDYDEAWRP